MNKGEFINYIAEQQNCQKTEAERIINIFTNSVTSALADGEEISLTGFGKFSTTEIAAREGRNPQTGEPIAIKAYIQPKFSAGQTLKDACKNKNDKDNKKDDKQNKNSKKSVKK